MKSKTVILGVFLVILMFLAINMSWARDPIPRYPTYRSLIYDRGKNGGKLTQKGFIRLNKEQRRFERARRQAWADGKLSYQEMRRLHQIRKKACKDIPNHKVTHRHYNRGYVSYRYERPAFPRFSISLSFSKPWIHGARSVGVK